MQYKSYYTTPENFRLFSLKADHEEEVRQWFLFELIAIMVIQ